MWNILKIQSLNLRKDEQGFVQLPPRGAPDRGPQVKEVLEV